MNEINILIGHTHFLDRQLFFGPFQEEDVFVKMPLSITMPQLMKALGIYESTSQAARAGFQGPVAEGYSEHPFSPPGKPWRRGTLAILKCSERMSGRDWLSLWSGYLVGKIKHAFR